MILVSPICEVQDQKICNDVLCFLNIYFEYEGVICNNTFVLYIYCECQLLGNKDFALICALVAVSKGSEEWDRQKRNPRLESGDSHHNLIKKYNRKVMRSQLRLLLHHHLCLPDLPLGRNSILFSFLIQLVLPSIHDGLVLEDSL